MEEKKIRPHKKPKLKYSIEDMQAFAKAKGGKCLSDKYKGILVKLQWQCKEGHTWLTQPKSVIGHNTWCPECSRLRQGNKRRRNIGQMQQMAKAKGGKCLSDKYNGMEVKLQWQCANGHKWIAMPQNIYNGSWCPRCYFIRMGHNPDENIKQCHEIGLKNGGKCLSTEYINNYTNLEWKCSKGHIWKAKPRLVKSGTWCPYCANNIKQTIGDLQLIAQKYGGKCLSKEYIRKKLLTWECSKGHIFDRRFDNIKRGYWCSICRREEKKAAKKLLQDSQK
jgi:hypothetical protein